MDAPEITTERLTLSRFRDDDAPAFFRYRSDPEVCRYQTYEPGSIDDALQFVRKLSGTTKPSVANDEVFELAVEEVVAAATRLLEGLVTTAPTKDREEEAAKARARNAKRFGTASK